MKYLLPCSCGESIPLDITQAGQTVTCRCGAAQQAPSLLNIKKLQIAEGDSPSSSARSSTFNAQLFFRSLGCFVLIPSLVFLFWALSTAPSPPDVLKKRIRLSYGGNVVWQDSTPISPQERGILLTHPEDIDDMPPFWVFGHFRTLKSGPMLSPNFQENYKMLKDAHRIRVSAGSIGTALGLFCLGISPFMPKRTKSVGVRKGSEWK